VQGSGQSWRMPQALQGYAKMSLDLPQPFEVAQLCSTPAFPAMNP